MRPAMIVLGLAVLILVVFVTIGVLVVAGPGAGQVGAAASAVPGRRCGRESRRRPAVAHRRRRASRRRTSVNAVFVPVGSVRVSHQDNSGTGPASTTRRWSSARGDSQGALLGVLRGGHEARRVGRSSTGDRRPTTRARSRSWASWPGSDGYYWEMGATVSPTTLRPGRSRPRPDRLHRPAAAGERRPGLSPACAGSAAVSGRDGRPPARAASSGIRSARPRRGQQVGPDEEVDRVEQVAHPRVRGQQDQRRHHHARDRADLRRRLRRVAVQMAGQEHGEHDARPRAAAPGSATGTRSRARGRAARWPPSTGWRSGPRGKSTTSSMSANGPRSANGKIVGTATTTMPASMDERAPLAVAAACRRTGRARPAARR